MFKNVPHVKMKWNVARMQVKHLLNVNRDYLIKLFIFNFEQASTCFSFILLVLALVYYSFLQAARGAFIGK